MGGATVVTDPKMADGDPKRPGPSPISVSTFYKKNPLKEKCAILGNSLIRFLVENEVLISILHLRLCTKHKAKAISRTATPKLTNQHVIHVLSG